MTMEDIDPETDEVMLVEGDPDFADIDTPPVTFSPEVLTLMGDMRDVILTRLRTMQKPWQMMTAEAQTDLANDVEYQAREIIRGTVRALNQHEWPHLVVTLGDVTIKGDNKGIAAKIECANISVNREALGDHAGKQVMLMMVDSDTFMAEREKVKIDGAQMDLPLGDEDGGGFDVEAEAVAAEDSNTDETSAGEP